MSDHELWNIASHLRTNFRYVDLTHAFFPGQPKFSMLEDQVTTRLFTVDEQGFTVDRYEIVGQWGTHVDPPIHFVNDARTLDELPVDEMILPLAVLDLHKEAEEFHNLAVTVDHIKAWEEKGCGKQVLLGTDSGKASYQKVYGSVSGIDYDPAVFCPRLIDDEGVDPDYVQDLLVDNAAAFFAFEPLAG